MTVSKDLYDRIIADRPFKLNAEEVNYRKSEGEELCESCNHFFLRNIDNHATCEIFRPANDEPVEFNYVCDFFSTDGEEFPLLTPKDTTSEER